MSIAASPPPRPTMTAEHERIEEQLDEEIAQVRSQIDALTKSRKLLASTLLSSTSVQEKLRRSTVDEDLETLIQRTRQHAQANLHRLAFGVTAFPFTDPSPETSDRPLLGIRFDICQRDGRFDSPYYVVCKRVNDESSELRIHRHTIPALVPLQDYEEKYLPLPDEGYGSEDSVMDLDGRRQDLHTFVRQVRSDLVNWRLRQQTIEMIREELGLTPPSPQESEDVADNETEISDEEGKFGVRDFSAVAVDARYARIAWTNGRAGRIKIGDNGAIERAVIFGGDYGREERCKDVERLLSSDQPHIETLLRRLEQLYEFEDSRN